jgi:hypothetical protein
MGPMRYGTWQSLKKIYGGRCSELFSTLKDFYCQELYPFDDTEREEGRKPELSPELKRRLVKEIDEELSRLKEFLESLESQEKVRTNLERKRLSVPAPAVLELMIKYEVHLDRRFARILAQLLSLQRSRRGEPDPPTLKVEVD